MIVQVRQNETAILSAGTVLFARTGSLSRSENILFESQSPLAWLNAAREIPQLAKVLRDVTLDSNRSSTSSFDWWSLFQRLPDWWQVANTLRSLTSQEHDTQGVARAEVARSIAVATTWSSADAAYWCGLMHSSASPGVDVILTVETSAAKEKPELCVAAAQLLLTYGGCYSDSTDAEISSGRTKFDFLCSRFPTVDWHGLVEEARDHFTSDFSPALSPVERELFLAWAEANACRIELSIQNYLREIREAKDELTVVNALCLMLPQCFGPSFHVWLQSGGPETGIARTVIEGEITSNDESPISFANFESAQFSDFSARKILRNERGEVAVCIQSADQLGFETQWPHEIEKAIKAFTSQRELFQNREKHGAKIRELAEREIQLSQTKFQQMIAEFSAGAGHEINNPLGTIAGKVQTLMRGEVDPSRRQSLGKISEQVDRIHRMIRDLHFVGSHVRTEKSKASLALVIAEGYAHAVAKFDAHQITLEPVSEAWQVYGNAAELSRMFAELIVNGAEAAGEEGRVTIRSQGSPANQRVIEVQIQDTGTGFTEMDRRHAFDPFYSGRSAGRGLGMGLCVVRRIADDHGITILLGASRPTTVTVLLPLAGS